MGASRGGQELRVMRKQREAYPFPALFGMEWIDWFLYLFRASGRNPASMGVECVLLRNNIFASPPVDRGIAETIPGLASGMQ